MDWIKDNWKRIAKYGGLGVGCIVVGLLAFVFARYLGSGAEYEGSLMDLAPAEVAIVARIDNVPNRKFEIERLLDHVVQQPSFSMLENSSLWQDSLGKKLGGSLEDFRRETMQDAISNAERGAGQAGATLFEDVLGGELIVCADPGASGQDYVVLSRVSRGVRFRWQFLDLASGFLPDDPSGTRMEYSGGILHITPRAEPGEPAPREILLALLDDVMVVSNSSRLLNASVQLHAGDGAGVSASEGYTRTLNLVDADAAEKHVAGVWLDLERLRARLPAKEGDDGRKVSPVDAYNSLPRDVEAIYPDIFVPVNQIVEHDMDSRPFRAAYYGLDISEPASIRFDQYLLVNEDRASQERYEYLRKTWAQPQAKETQLNLLPPDTIMQVSYRQPVEVLYNEVFDDDSRASLVGDFVVALRGPGVKQHARGDVEEMAFALAPVEYAPDAPPVPTVNIPMPAFALMFRVPGADPQVARALLEEYLAAQRGRTRKPGEEAPTGRVSVVEKQIAGAQAFGFHDPREDETIIVKLNKIICSALVGDWLMLSNSEQLLSYAINAQRGEGGLAANPGSAWRLLPDTGSATMYLNFEQFADYAGSPALAQTLRSNRYNPTLIEGRDPGELRREIAAEVLGKSIADVNNDDLVHPEVNKRYGERRTAWERVCAVEGAKYEMEYRADMQGLTFFRDLALITKFATDHLHVRGVLRIG